MKFPSLLFAYTGICLCLTGCGDGGDNSLSPVTSTRSYQDLRVAFTATQGTYAVGSDVPATITLTNTGTQRIRLDYSDCGASLVVLPTTANTAVYANPSTCGVGQPILIDAGQTQTLSLPWVGTSNLSGGRVTPGTYSLDPIVLFFYNGETKLRDLSPTGVQIQVR